MHILVDPGMIVPPDIAAGAAAVEDYAERLVAWRDEVHGGNHHFWLSWRYVSAIWDESCWPTTSGLQRLIHELGLEDVSPKDVVSIVDGLLKESRYFEDYFQTSLLEVKPDDIVVDPDLIARLSRLPSSIAQAFKVVLGLTAGIKGAVTPSHPDAEDLLLLTEPVGTAERVAIDATVGTLEQGAYRRVDVHAILPLVVVPDHVLCLQDPVELWHRGDPALALEWIRLTQGITAPFKTYTIASDCIDTIAKKKLADHPQFNHLLRQMATVLTNPNTPTNRYSQHTIFSSPTMTDAAGREWEAWRCPVPPKWRIHYWWSVKAQHVIIMDVHTQHDDFDIPDARRYADVVA